MCFPDLSWWVDEISNRLVAESVSSELESWEQKKDKVRQGFYSNRQARKCMDRSVSFYRFMACQFWDLCPVGWSCVQMSPFLTKNQSKYLTTGPKISFESLSDVWLASLQ